MYILTLTIAEESDGYGVVARLLERIDKDHSAPIGHTTQRLPKTFPEGSVDPLMALLRAAEVFAQGEQAVHALEPPQGRIL